MEGNSVAWYVIVMNIFSYDNIWLAISMWGMGITAAIFVLIVMGGKGDKPKVWAAAWIIFTLSIGFMTVAGFVAHDRNTHAEAYQQEVRDHIKTTGDFDSVTGKLEFNPEKPSVYKVKFGEVQGDCFAALPEEGEALQFGCGSEFAPLEEAKEPLTKFYEAEKAEEAKKAVKTDK